MLKVVEKQKLFNEVVVIEVSKRNLEYVAIGSIVKIERFIAKNNLANIEVWEIVGYAESNPQNKKVAYDTPLGKILLKMRKGETKAIKDAINGLIKYKIIQLFSSWDEVN
jgi:transcription elongation GreA/GreB family factor